MEEPEKTMKEPEHFDWLNFFDDIVDFFAFIIVNFPQIIGILIFAPPLLVILLIFDSLDKRNERLKEERLKEERLQNESGKNESNKDEELTKWQNFEEK